MADAPRSPYPEATAPVTDLDLEAQIALAEAAVITRDNRIRRNAGLVAHRVKREAVKHAGGGLLIGVATMALAWWINRRRPAAAPAAPAAAPEPPSLFDHLLREAGFTLVGLLPMLWPLLPRGFRRHVSPAAASSVLTFLAPFFGRIFRRKPPSQAQG
jgi:hypothetical protein